MVQFNPLGFFKTKWLNFQLYMTCVGLASTEVLIGPLVPTIGTYAGNLIMALVSCVATNCLQPPTKFFVNACYENAEDIYVSDDETTDRTIKLKSDYELAKEAMDDSGSCEDKDSATDEDHEYVQ